MGKDVRIKFNSEFDGKGIRKYVDDINSQINKINLAPQVEKELKNTIKVAEASLKKLVNFDFSTGDTKGYLQLVANTEKLVENIKSKLAGLEQTDFKVPVNTEDLTKIDGKIKEIETKVKILSATMQNELKNALTVKGFDKDVVQAINTIDDLKDKISELQLAQAPNITSSMTDGQASRYARFGDSIEEIRRAKEMFDELSKMGLQRDQLDAAVKDVDGFIAKLGLSGDSAKEQAEHIKMALAEIDKVLTTVGAPKSGKSRGRGIGTINATVEAFNKAEENIRNHREKMAAEIQSLNDVMNNMDESVKREAELRKTLAEFKTERVSLVEGPGDTAEIERQRDSVQALGNEYLKVSQDIDIAKISSNEFIEATNKATGDAVGDKIKRFALQWFGVTQAIQMTTRQVKKFWNVYKDLDTKIGSIAMVTGQPVSKAWGEVMEYNQIARDLAVTTGDIAIQAEEFARQGRNHNETMALIESTTKMGTIANMNFSDSLDYMTAAVNGFNISAEDSMRVSDVFSRLDAVAATSVEELAIALSKTSSIAASAGMDFEYTTAALTTMIETTREAPKQNWAKLKCLETHLTDGKPLRAFSTNLGRRRALGQTVMRLVW